MVAMGVSSKSSPLSRPLFGFVGHGTTGETRSFFSESDAPRHVTAGRKGFAWESKVVERAPGRGGKVASRDFLFLAGDLSSIRSVPGAGSHRQG